MDLVSQTPRPRGRGRPFFAAASLPDNLGYTCTLCAPTSPLPNLVAYDCGCPLWRYTCRTIRVAADFLDFIALCRCSTGVALHPLKFWCRTSPPPVPGGVAPKFGSEKVSRYTEGSQLQLWVSRYTVQLSFQIFHINLTFFGGSFVLQMCCPNRAILSKS